MRAIATANEASAMEKVNEQRAVAKKMEGLENRARVNEAINKATANEEAKVIEAANKRMAEVHLKKEQSASAAATEVAKAKAAT